MHRKGQNPSHFCTDEAQTESISAPKRPKGLAFRHRRDLPEELRDPHGPGTPFEARRHHREPERKRADGREFTPLSVNPRAALLLPLQALLRCAARERHKLATVRHMCESPGSSRHRGSYPIREPWSSHFHLAPQT
jgi:hypothetical protein